ncbi:carbon starvation CstA family protein [Natronobeatus ordinarius]|uniref:carbon starvation CstA family protein n=1 Tax=Natronobeatus ordinarius TaxID=2963433 RepID=UPI0020CFD69C|nr:carbon starvation CstA family protein [Natronobeatus ordinarius]
MQVIWFVVFVLVTFTVGYVGYSKYLANQLVELDDERETPAHKYEDGQEYVPSKKPVLLGHHFSSIAGGAPIAGPLTAVAAFGWLPALLWVAIGNPIFGAVHDFMALSSSVRHEGKSIGYIIGEYVGQRGKNMLLWFAILLTILVVAAFVFLIASVMNAYPPAATASIVYIVLAILFGIYLYQFNGPFLPGAALFIAAVFGGIFVGIEFPIAIAEVEGLPDNTIVLLGDGAALSWLPLADQFGVNFAAWAVLTIIYTFFAATLPVWLLLQPRDFLTSTILYVGIAGMLLGVIVGTVVGFTSVDVPVAGFEDPITIESLTAAVPAFTGFVSPELGPLLPFLFLTIACGTISGFHSLVSSGTTAKQLDKESDARTIGYGAMLGEGLLAVTAIIAVSLAAATVTDGLANAIAIFPAGGGALVTVFGVSAAVGSTFIALLFLSFLLTSTDTAVRLGRYMIEELIGTPETTFQETMTNRYMNAAVIALGGYILVASGTWESIWPLFGGANQLLAVLALLVATVWLANWSDTKQLLTTGVPLVFMTVVTTVGLVWLALLSNTQAIMEIGELNAASVALALQSLIALVLVALALSLIYMGVTNIRESRAGVGADAVTDGGQPEEEN